MSRKPKWKNNVANLAGPGESPRWYVRYREISGRWTKRNSGQATRAAAVGFLEDMKARVRRGEAGFQELTPQDRTKKTVTVRELFTRFVGDVAGEAGYAPPRIKSLHNYRRAARMNFRARIGPAVGERVAASVTVRDVERFRDGMLARDKAGASVVQALAHLSKLYAWARREGLVDCANPVQGVERPRMNQSTDYLTAVEVGALLAAAERDAVADAVAWDALMRYPMIATAIYAGLRKGELFGLRWCDVRLEAGQIDVLRSYKLLPKSGKPRHVPVHPELERALRAWRVRCPAAPEALVFPVIGGERGRWHMGEPQDNVGLKELLAAASCHLPADGHVWHMLRHTFASHAVMSGTPLYEVSQLLGHATLQMTMRYAHLAPDHQRAAVARLKFPAPAPAIDVADLGEERRKRATLN